MSLFTAELRRLAKRRFARYMALLGLLVLVGIAAFTAVTNQQIGPAQVAAAKRSAEQDYQRQAEMSDNFRRECEQAQKSGTAPERGHFPRDCAAIEPPRREAFNYEWYLPATFEFRTDFPEMITAFAAILGLVAFVVGASYIGAEWSTGGMMNLLLWRPQRVTVLLTKLGALLAALSGTALVAGTAWAAAFWAIGTWRGSMAGVTSGVWQSFGLAGLRGAVLALVAGAIGFGLASLGRHTALALGGAVALMVVGQFGVGMVLSMADVRFMEAWLLPTYVMAWMQQKVTLRDWQSCGVSYTGECEPATMDIVWQDSAMLFAASLLLVVGAALWAIRRRDVT